MPVGDNRPRQNPSAVASHSQMEPLAERVLAVYPRAQQRPSQGPAWPSAQISFRMAGFVDGSPKLY